MSRAIALRLARANLRRKGVKPLTRDDLLDLMKRAVRGRWFDR